jgi:hypothetical protein
MMKMFGSSGCPARRELFAEHAEYRQCDGCELNIQAVMMPLLQAPVRFIQTYSANDIV